MKKNEKKKTPSELSAVRASAGRMGAFAVRMGPNKPGRKPSPLGHARKTITLHDDAYNTMRAYARLLDETVVELMDQLAERIIAENPQVKRIKGRL